MAAALVFVELMVAAGTAEGDGLTELLGLKKSASVLFAGDGDGVTVGETAAVVFPLRACFAAGEGDAHSSEAVRHRIKEMIEAEPASDVLSDDKIVERLKLDGVDIARRTVAKYREALRIPSSVQRRRQKRIAAGTA